MLQQPNVVCHPVAALGDGGQHVQNPAVQLPGVGLTADGEALGEAEIPADFGVHGVDFGSVSVKQVQKACLGAGGAPTSQESHVVDDKVQLFQVGYQVLHPQGGPLAHRDQLCRLIVGVAQGGHGFIGVGKFGKICQHLQKLSPEIFQTVPVENNVRVVRDIAAGCAQVDDAGSIGSCLAVGVDVSHYVMAHLFFPGGGAVIVDVGNMGFQLSHLLGGNGQS